MKLHIYSQFVAMFVTGKYNFLQYSQKENVQCTHSRNNFQPRIYKHEIIYYYSLFVAFYHNS